MPCTKIKVGVLMGGKSVEREVSFNSGRTICDHLDHHTYQIIPIFQTHNGKLYVLPWHFLHRGKIDDFYNRLKNESKKIIWDDLKQLVDFVYLAVHGRFGEDGTIQGLLEVLEIPYLGAKVYGSSLGMNKIIQKKVLQKNGIDVARDVVIFAHEVKNIGLDDILLRLHKQNIKFPCIVKPCHEGSSLGISIANDSGQLINAIKNAAYIDPEIVQDVLIEEIVQGMEFVCLSLQGSLNKRCNKSTDDWYAVAVTEVIPESKDGFFDYDQKYMPGRATKITPARCDKKNYLKIMEVCNKASRILNFSTISRIDGFLTKDGRIVLIDPNSLTGMGPATFLFNQAAEVGMSHTQLINYLIETELQNYGLYTKFLKDKENRTMDFKDKLKVAVLLGGDSNEREISLESGRNVCYKLSPYKYEIIPIFVNQKRELFKLNQKLLVQNSTREISEMLTSDVQIKWVDLPGICDFVFIALHGGIGENGSVQGSLEMLNLPYNGSGVLASSLCIDKFKTSDFLKSQGFDVAKSILVNSDQNIDDQVLEISKDFSFPVIVKPHDDGCSFGVEKINDSKQLSNIINKFFKGLDKKVLLVEEFIDGIELTGGVFGNQEVVVLPPSQAVVGKDILSIEEKFLPGAGQNITPAPLPKEQLSFVQKIIGKVYKSLDCKGYARIDCFFQSKDISPTKKDRLVILEVNTLPGLTPATCIFHQAAEIGLKPMDFIDKIIELGLTNHSKNINLHQNISMNPKSKSKKVQCI